jgi:hypothetical protein
MGNGCSKADKLGVNEELIKHYLVLVIASLLLMDHVQLQRLLLLLWLIWMCVHWINAYAHGVTHRPLFFSVLVSQLPGVVFAVMSLTLVIRHHTSEWANGLLEIWYTPFLPLLELLPPKRIGHFSDVYLATCLLPAAMLFVSWLCYQIGRARSARMAN